VRLAVISDIHGNLVALEAVLEDIRRRAPDAVVNLGDCVTSPLWPRETFELLQTLGVATVRGNHDRWIAAMPADEPSQAIRYTHEALTSEQRAALGGLPPSVTPVDGVLAVHGTPASDVEYLLEDKVDGRLSLATHAALSARLEGIDAELILCGHSHHQHTAWASGGRLVVNPGSVGHPRSVDNVERMRVEAGSPHARYAIVTRRGRQWSAEMIALAYNWSAAAERARSHGRADWADAFLGIA
jgi:predicted phosphodiesterase